MIFNRYWMLRNNVRRKLVEVKIIGYQLKYFQLQNLETRLK